MFFFLGSMVTVYTFLMHRSLLADSWPGCARSSNLRALATVAVATMSAQLNRLEKTFMLCRAMYTGLAV